MNIHRNASACIIPVRCVLTKGRWVIFAQEGCFLEAKYDWFVHTDQQGKLSGLITQRSAVPLDYFMFGHEFKGLSFSCSLDAAFCLPGNEKGGLWLTF